MYHTSFFMIFWAGHKGASLVHDLHDFSWPFCMILQFFGGIPIHITHHFPWFFEPVTIVLVLCMVCMILHDHISWFCIFGRFTPTYHTSFFLVFCHNVKQVFWKSFILLIKIAPVLLLCNWICGGQECLDDHPWHLL